MLKTDYKDDVLNTDINVNRKFSIVRSNGTVVEQNVELRETTAFKQTGDSFGAKDINETNEAINDVRGQICTNLLNPTAKTQTINGVTFTNNGDGTYTVNGTANGRCFFRVGNMTVKKDNYAKITGCPKNGGEGTYYLRGTNTVDYDLGADTGSGHIFHNTSNYTEFYTYIIISIGFTCNNLLFKPMVTTDLNATYDDFVPYTGNSGRLNEDVANLIKGISSITNSDIDTILNS